MAHLPKNEFPATQPDPYLQRPVLRKTRWYAPVPHAPHVPNRISFAGLLGYGWLVFVFGTWALIGGLSGHMHVIAVHSFAGLPALLLALGMLSLALMWGSQILDHVDRRDNEDAYQRARRLLFWAAVALCMAAWIMAEFHRLIDDSGWGLLSARELQQWVSPKWLVEKLRPMQPSMDDWMIQSLFWFLGWGLVLRWLGLLSDDRSRPTIPRLIAVYWMVVPPLAGVSINVLWSVVSGGAAFAGDSDEDKLAGLSFLLSALLTMASIWLVLLATPFFAFAGRYRHRVTPTAGEQMGPVGNA